MAFKLGFTLSWEKKFWFNWWLMLFCFLFFQSKYICGTLSTSKNHAVIILFQSHMAFFLLCNTKLVQNWNRSCSHWESQHIFFIIYYLWLIKLWKVIEWINQSHDLRHHHISPQVSICFFMPFIMNFYAHLVVSIQHSILCNITQFA